MNKISLFSIFLLSLLLSHFHLHASNIKPGNLKVEYTQTPLGIDVEKIRFSWQMISDSQQRGCYQTAYQIIVTSEKGETVWNSEKKNSDVTLNIIYDGTPLKATTRYNWIVNIWDQNGQLSSASSWFETGLMNPDPSLSAWGGAKWIGGGSDDLVLYSSYIPAFKINYSIQLDKNSKTTKAGFIYGANDNRLMDKNKNIYQIESGKDESFIMIETDISNVSNNAEDNAFIHIYRIGYHTEDKKNIPFKSFSIPTTIINEKNKYEAHTVYLRSSFGTTGIYIDGTEDANKIGETFLNPLNPSINSADFIAFPMLADIGFYVPAKQKALFSAVEIHNYRDPSNRLFCEEFGNKSYEGIFSVDAKNKNSGLVIKDNLYQIEGKEETKIIANPGKNSMPMLRTTFQSPSAAAKARLYVTARGIYEIFINGQRIGTDYFNPGLTQYNKTHMYQTYDVTDYIKTGKNAIGALLGEGWWSGNSTYTGEFWNFFGDRQSLLAKLVITYPNGQEETIVTNPETWSYYNDGPIVYGSFFQGEVYDAQKEAAIEGWNTANFNELKWKKAQEVTLKNNISKDELNKHRNTPMTDDYSKMSLIGQFGENVAKIKELTALSVEEVRPGVFIYDMGQNMVGVPKISLSGQKPGTRIILRFAEVKYPDLTEYKNNVGTLMLENIRGALSQDIYITKGGDETINPRLTFHGYRFIEISGTDKPLPIEAIKGEVMSSIHQLASSYETSNPKVNKLWENITWSTFGNFLSIPTDCPQRNERLGWSGDISVFSRTATYLASVPQFLRRHMLAMRDVQREDGRFSDIAPLGGGFGGILWGSAGITVAWESYQQYNDKQVLSEHYDAMKSYINYLRKFINPETGVLTEGDLGDWLGPEQDKNDNTLLWEAYFIYDLEIMQKAASILDKKEDEKDFKNLYDQRKKFFNKTYIAKDTKKTVRSSFKQYGHSTAVEGDLIDTQISYILPLVFNLYDNNNKKKGVENLISTVVRENVSDNGTICQPYSLMTGFIGTAWINKAFSDNGYDDIAYRVLQQTSYPSWLYSVDQGATTIWERLNSYTHTDGFGGNNRMNSFNHYSFGAVGAWMYNYSLGIQRDENHPGFKHFILQPTPDPTGEMTYAKGYYDSMYGRISSSWEVKDDTFHYYFIVPANTSATLYLPTSAIQQVKEGGKSIKDSTGIENMGLENNKIKLELQSGTYHFSQKKIK